jgi:hypothetical protein
MRTAKDGFRGTKDETVKLGETDTGGQVSVTQVGPKNFNGTKRLAGFSLAKSSLTRKHTSCIALTTASCSVLDLVLFIARRTSSDCPHLSRKALIAFSSTISGFSVYALRYKSINNPKEDSSRSDGGDAGSVVTTSSPVPKVKVKSMAIMMIQGQVEGTPVD